MDDHVDIGARAMSKPDSDQRFFAKCRSCGAIFSATRRPDGEVKPIGVAADCACGDDDFYRIPTAEED